jgi:hypothetical protein
MPNILSMLKNLKISINNKNSYAKIEVDKLEIESMNTLIRKFDISMIKS